MAELVERYVHQVGRYLPRKERAEIEAELRSMIQDKLDDRYESVPTQEDVASVLSEMGDPRRMAASYNNRQYLVGPDLYPNMMRILRFGWLTIPPIVIFLNIVMLLASSAQNNLSALIVEPIIAAFQTTFVFSAVVVLMFAILQHSGVEFEKKKEAFNPLKLPKVNDPTAVDRSDQFSTIVTTTLNIFVLLYWLRVGGLTLRFDLSNPGEVIPTSTPWLTLFAITFFIELMMHLVILRYGRWGVGSRLFYTGLNLFATLCGYFVAFRPVFERIVAANPALGDMSFLSRTPEIITVIAATMILVSGGRKQLQLWNYRNHTSPPMTKADS